MNIHVKRNIPLLLFLLSFFCVTSVVAGIPHTNLFEPFDYLMIPPLRPEECWQPSFAYEGVTNQRAFQADEDEFGCSRSFRKVADPLQLYQCEQDLLAALKGDEFLTEAAQLAQKFNLDDDDGTFGLFIPSGEFDISNYMFSLRRYLNHGFSVSFHLPVISMKLKNVQWRQSPNNMSSFDSNVTDELIAEIERIGDLNLYNWERSGVGDFSTIIWWEKEFPQARPFLEEVSLGARAGLMFPTGKGEDDHVMLGFPFGEDLGMGVVFGGTLELTFCRYYMFGVDMEFIHTSGKSKTIRIKTDPAQTDLTFLTTSCAFVEPGFYQHYTLFGRLGQFWHGLGAEIAYQYTKQQDNHICLSSSHFNALLANNAESLQSWTEHSVIFMVDLDFYAEENSYYKPFISVFYKHGFNGSRALSFDTMGCIIAVDF